MDEQLVTIFTKQNLDYIDPAFLLKRIFFATLQCSSLIIFFGVLAKLLGNPAQVGEFSTFFSTAYFTSLILLAGQDRLIFILIPQLKATNQSSRSYLTFIFLALALYSIILLAFIVSFSTFFKAETHPLQLGLCFSPFFVIYEFSQSLLNAVGRPFLSRCMSIISLAIITLILIVSKSLLATHLEATFVAYLSTTVYFIVGCLGLFLANSILLSQDNLKSDKSTGSILAQISFGFYQSFLLLKHHKTNSHDIFNWLKKGIPLALARMNDGLFSGATGLLYFLGISPETIAYFTVAKLLLIINAEISVVIRNHLIPKITSLLTSTEDRQLSISSRSQLCAIVCCIWCVILCSTAIIVLISKPIFSLYGPDYAASFPMLLILLVLYFLTHGWAINRAVLTLYDQFRFFLSRYQTYRTVSTLILMPILVKLFGVYGVLFALGVPTLLASAVQLFRIKQHIGLNLLWCQKTHNNVVLP